MKAALLALLIVVLLGALALLVLVVIGMIRAIGDAATDAVIGPGLNKLLEELGKLQAELIALLKKRNLTPEDEARIKELEEEIEKKKMEIEEYRKKAGK